jgi:hypothetical protein
MKAMMLTSRVTQKIELMTWEAVRHACPVSPRASKPLKTGMKAKDIAPPAIRVKIRSGMRLAPT